MSVLVSGARVSSGYYCLFVVADDWHAAHAPGNTERTKAQGFARWRGFVLLDTLIEFGEFCVWAHLAEQKPRIDPGWQRAHAIPLDVERGEVCIAGPDDAEPQLRIPVPAGRYMLYVGQTKIPASDSHEEAERIDLYFVNRTDADTGAQVLVADQLLHPELPLEEETPPN